jgi:hypothetical protein
MRESGLRRAAVAACLLLAGQVQGQEAPAGALEFVPCAGDARVLDLEALGGAEAGREVTVADPVYRRAKRYAALPMRGVLERGFAAAVLATAGARFRLIAADGYTKSASGALLSDGSGFLAFRDAQASPGAWEPLEKGGDPGPFYLVWTGARASERPWPYQLVRIEQECPASP